MAETKRWGGRVRIVKRTFEDRSQRFIVQQRGSAFAFPERRDEWKDIDTCMCMETAERCARRIASHMVKSEEVVAE